MASSSDGVVTATLDSTTASVFLTLNFAASGSVPAGISGVGGRVNLIVKRTANGVQLPVRGLDSVLAPNGILAGIDHEAPLGAVCTYQAVATTTDGVTTVATSTTVSVTTPSTPVMWLKHLTQPSLSVQLRPMTLPAWVENQPRGVFPVSGSRFPVVVEDARQAPTGDHVVKLSTASDRSALLALLRAGGPYFYTSAGYGEEDSYVGAGDATRTRITGVSADPLRTFALSYVTQDRPASAGVSVAIPGHTYDDSTARWATYAARSGTYLARTTT